MATHARPVNVGDLVSLAPIDASYAAARALEGVVSRAALHLYERSGHSFVAQTDAGAVTGFVLAQAIWSGDRAVVSVNRLALARDDDHDSATALVKALSKSAYDSAVYHLEVALPRSDSAARAALEAELFFELPNVVYARGLGSRAEIVARAATGHVGDGLGGSDG